MTDYQIHKSADLSTLPFFSSVYSDILKSGTPHHGTLWLEDQFYLEFTDLLSQYSHTQIQSPTDFYDLYLYKKFHQDIQNGHIYTLEFITSYQKFFGPTFECRTLSFLLQNSPEHLKPLLNHYLKCRNSLIPGKKQDFTQQLPTSTDNCYMPREEVSEWVMGLYGDLG